jgi:anti-sigma regulatory factor (Ser/Thr protein kinase)
MWTPTLSRRFPASARAIPKLRHETVAFAKKHCGENQQLVDDIALAVTEAGGNVVQHAYAKTASGKIEFEAWQAGDELVIEVADSGVGMNADIVEAGYGLALIRAIAELTVRAEPRGGTRLRMAFPCRG